MNAPNLRNDQFKLLSAPDQVLQLDRDWRRLQRESPRWSSPYYCWEFVAAAMQAREVQAVVMQRAGQITGIWPFHPAEGGTGVPVGGALNDYHGPLVSADATFPPEKFLATAELRKFDFHSHFPIQPSLERCAFHRRLKCAWAELSPTPQDYLEQLCKSSTRVARQGQKSRKMLRELGPVRLEFHSPAPADLDWLIASKREKYRRTGCPDYFSPEWCRSLISQLHHTQAGELRGVCSILWAGDQRVAGHFGMIAGETLHYWLPVFSPKHAKYSPGLELYLRIVAECSRRGISRIDFGYGEEDYKQTLATHWDHVLVGSIDRNRVRFHWNNWLENTRMSIKQSSYREFARDLARSILPNLGKPKIR